MHEKAQLLQKKKKDHLERATRQARQEDPDKRQAPAKLLELPVLRNEQKRERKGNTGGTRGTREANGQAQIEEEKS